MKTLVTGGLGFLGSALVRALVKKGGVIRVFDNSSRGSVEKLGAVANEVEIIEGDIRDPALVRKAIRGMDRVAHLAFVNGTEYFYRYPAYVLDVGIKGMANVLDGCIQEGVNDLVVASSSEVYQTPPVVPTPETVPLSIPDIMNPRYSYGGGKILNELMALNYACYFDRVIVLRPHNVYGPAMGYEHVIPQFTTRMIERSTTTKNDAITFSVQGSGNQTRSFIEIDDFTAGLILAMERGEHRNIYHIGTTEEVRISELASLVAGELGLSITLEPGPEIPGGTPRRCPDIAKLRALGFESKIPLAEGLKRTVQWYRAHPATDRKITEPRLFFLSSSTRRQAAALDPEPPEDECPFDSDLAKLGPRSGHPSPSDAGASPRASVEG